MTQLRKLTELVGRAFLVIFSFFSGIDIGIDRDFRRQTDLQPTGDNLDRRRVTGGPADDE
jgi:hypothetical protein